MNTPGLQRTVFLLLLCAVTVAFWVILWPFVGAVFWGVVLAILFNPLHKRVLLRMPRRNNLAALLTMLVCLLIVILPLLVILTSLIQEAAFLYQRMQSGQMNFGSYFEQIMGILPDWVLSLLDRLGLGDFASLQAKLTQGAMQASQYVGTKAINIGQNTFQFIISFGIMLYLLFFLLRDGRALMTSIIEAIPLEPSHKRELIAKFTTVVRATVKGSVLVALTQGLLGGLALWVLGIQGVVLWTTLMAFLSLLPAIGAGLVWGPIAIYFLATGNIVEGLGLIAYGVLVIGMVDNVLRPILVGKDTRMPDYVVLISTIGGMSIMGVTGFVIGPVIAALFMAAWGLFVGRTSEELEQTRASAKHHRVTAKDAPKEASSQGTSKSASEAVPDVKNATEKPKL